MFFLFAHDHFAFAKGARYRVAIVLGSEEVPPNIFLRDAFMAENILTQKGKIIFRFEF